MDTLILSRLQFAANMSFHILFPTITIAMCWLLLFFRIRVMVTQQAGQDTVASRAWEEAYYFWTKVFALTFALGVVSGITMSSFPYRFGHMLLASMLTASFLMAGLSAWQIIKGTATAGTRKALHTAIIAASIAIPLQILMGDAHGLNTLKHQPAKIAAIEGVWNTEKGAPLTLLGFPSSASWWAWAF